MFYALRIKKHSSSKSMVLKSLKRLLLFNNIKDAAAFGTKLMQSNVISKFKIVPRKGRGNVLHSTSSTMLLDFYVKNTNELTTTKSTSLNDSSYKNIASKWSTYDLQIRHDLLRSVNEATAHKFKNFNQLPESTRNKLLAKYR